MRNRKVRKEMRKVYISKKRAEKQGMIDQKNEDDSGGTTIDVMCLLIMPTLEWG